MEVRGGGGGGGPSGEESSSRARACFFEIRGSLLPLFAAFLVALRVRIARVFVGGGFRICNEKGVCFFRRKGSSVSSA